MIWVRHRQEQLGPTFSDPKLFFKRSKMTKGMYEQTFDTLGFARIDNDEFQAKRKKTWREQPLGTDPYALPPHPGLDGGLRGSSGGNAGTATIPAPPKSSLSK